MLTGLSANQNDLSVANLQHSNRVIDNFQTPAVNVVYTVPYISSAVNQGCCGSCYAVAIASAIQDELRAVDAKVYVSPNALMAERKLEHTAGCLGGMIAGDELREFLLTTGLDLRSTYPECIPDTCDGNIELNQQTHKQAMQFCLQGSNTQRTNCYEAFFFSHCMQRFGDDRALMEAWNETTSRQVIQQAVIEGHTIVGSLVVTEGFRDVNSPSWLRLPYDVEFQRENTETTSLNKVYVPTANEGAEVELHAICVVGFVNVETADFNGCVYVVRNSWGTEWATDGFALVASSNMKTTRADRVRNLNIFDHGKAVTDDVMLSASYGENVHRSVDVEIFEGTEVTRFRFILMTIFVLVVAAFYPLLTWFT